MSDPTRPRTSSQRSFTSTHRRALTRMRDGASYFKVYHDYIRILGLTIEQAAVLSDMINTSIMKNAEDHGGWFDYTVKWMEYRTGIKIRTQHRVISTLKDANCIEITKAGNPARRRIRINIEDIENTIAAGINSHQ